jgi:mono/diheme cytochrome c family protein
MMRLQVAVSLLAALPLVAPAQTPTPPKKADPKKPVEELPDIPDAARDRRSPVMRSEQTLRLGRALWLTHCETCHGTAGKGDGPNARLHERRKGHAPRNLTDPNVQENLTDGEIFWRVTNGIIEAGDNIIMPTYESKTTETERWLLVLYVRELGKAGAK